MTLKRNMMALAAMAACLGALAAVPDYELPLTADSFQGGWDSQYFEADHTIQYTEAFGANGWYWYDGHDFSEYDQVVIEYSSRGPGVRLSVGYLDSEEYSNSDWMTSNYDEVVCDLDASLKSKVRSIMLLGNETGYVGIKRAYLRVKPAVDPTATVVLFEGSQSLDWWEHSVQILPSRLKDVVPGDKLVVNYTGSGSTDGVECILKIDTRCQNPTTYQYECASLPSTVLSPLYKDGGLHFEEYDGEDGTFTTVLSPSDVTALTQPTLDCLFLTGAHCIVTKVSLVPKAAAGIGEIATPAQTEPVYYDLQGRRAANPETGLYIRVAGGKAEKVMVK